jgi:chitooligosaccharide deacetylase
LLDSDRIDISPMSSFRKFLFLMAFAVFCALLGTRLPLSSSPQVQALSPLTPLASMPAGTLSKLPADFPQVPLRLQPPVTGVTDLTVETIQEWLSDRSPEVFLTFDDGPSPKATGMILDLLREHDIKATFFVLGRNAVLFPELVQRIVAEGHELALHSQSHADMRTLTREQKVQEIAEGLSTLHWLVPDTRIRWFRPPYGHYDQEVVNIAHEYGMCLALFNDISTDSHSTAEQIAQSVFNGRGKIIVFHDGQMPRPSDLTEAEKRLLEGLTRSVGQVRAQGGQFKTLSSHFERFCP